MAKGALTLTTVLLLATLATCTENSKSVSVFWTKNGGYKVVESQQDSTQDIWNNNGGPVAITLFTNSINKTGWSYLEVQSNPDFDDRLQAYGAGFAEGLVTAELIHTHWLNMFEQYCSSSGMAIVCKRLDDYISINNEWISKKLDENCGKDRSKCLFPYWHQVDLFYEQMKGLGAGYRQKAIEAQLPLLTDDQILFMNIQGDMEDLSQSLVHNNNLDVKLNHVLGDGHCSALIKLLPGNKDLYTSQVSWSAYNSMTRILKKYNLAYSTDGHSQERIPGQSMSFSGYPGLIFSSDDYTIISPSGLTTQETTIGNSNPKLWEWVVPTETIFEGIRSTVANRLAKSGQEWTWNFSSYNSGTYNNQWMIVDYKQFTPGQPLGKGSLWILEQLPGKVHYEDMTSFLDEHKYWPSYNSPYFKSIYNLSGAPALVEKYGDWFTYEKTPRALIFKRDHAKVKDLASMEKLMRYNNYKKDPLAACDCSPPYSGENGISCRSDLNPKNGTYPFPTLGHRNHGGTDMKITNHELSKTLQMLAVSSPTYDDLPPFQWSKADFADTTPHHGLPDLWNFKPEVYKWQLKW